MSAIFMLVVLPYSRAECNLSNVFCVTHPRCLCFCWNVTLMAKIFEGWPCSLEKILQVWLTYVEILVYMGSICENIIYGLCITMKQNMVWKTILEFDAKLNLSSRVALIFKFWKNFISLFWSTSFLLNNNSYFSLANFLGHKNWLIFVNRKISY